MKTLIFIFIGIICYFMLTSGPGEGPMEKYKESLPPPPDLCREIFCFFTLLQGPGGPGGPGGGKY